MEGISKRLSFISTNNANHRLSDGIHSFTPSFSIRQSEMTESSSHQNFITDQANALQLIDRNASINRHYQRTLTTNTTVIMQDDDYITTPTKRLRGNSVFEESLLSAHNYIKRKFSYGSSD